MLESIFDEAVRLGLTIGAPRAWPLDAVDRGALQAHLWAQGYFATAPSIPSGLVDRCRDAIALVRRHGAPALAAFVFDAPWELATVLSDHASAAVDGEARLLPSLRAEHRYGEPRGSPPERDHPARELDDRGAPESLTLWVALTDATPDNGCIYVVPAPWDPAYGDPRAPSQLLLQAIRAVPARAGAVLGWTSKLLHWDAMADDHAPPRISLAFELQAAYCLPFDEVSYPLGWIPSLDERRALVARQWARDAHAADAERRAELDRVVDQLLAR